MLLDDLEHLFYKKKPELLTQNNRPVTKPKRNKGKTANQYKGEKTFVLCWNLLTF